MAKSQIENKKMYSTIEVDDFLPNILKKCMEICNASCMAVSVNEAVTVICCV